MITPDSLSWKKEMALFFKTTFETVAAILLMMAVGFVTAGFSWYKENNGTQVLSKLVVNIIIPINLFYKVVSAYSTREELFDIIQGLPVPFLSISLMFLIAYALYKLFRVDEKRRGVFLNVAAMSNTVLVGITVIEPLLGPESAPYSLLYYTANTIFFWTLGTFLIRRDAGDQAKIFSLSNLKKVLAPPFISFLLGSLFVLLEIPLFPVFEDVISRFSDSATPVSMLLIGAIIRSVPLRSYRFGKDMIIGLVSRFLISPLLMAGICLLLPIPVLMKQTFFLMSCMPVMTQCGIMSREYKADYAYASTMVAATTALCMLLIPVYMLLLQYVNIFG